MQRCILGAKIRPLFHPRGVRCGHVARLDVDGERVGVMAEQVDAKGSADGEELLRVDGGLVEEFLEGARCDADVVGEPLVGVTRAAQLVADKVANVNLHSGCFFVVRRHPYRRRILRAAGRDACVPGLATESACSDDHRQKKKASNLVSSLRS